MIRTGWSAGLVAVLALAAHPATATNACTSSAAPLQINPTPVRLPAGRVGKAYRHRLHATGGVPPYTYYAQTLPPGFTLSADGTLQGKASPLPLLTLFTVRVCDKNDDVAQDTFRLAIVSPRRRPRLSPKPSPKPAPKPAPKPPPKPQEPPPSGQSVVVYTLTPAILKQLKPKAKSSAGAASTQGGGTADPTAEEAAGVDPEDYLPAIDSDTSGAAAQSTTKSSTASAAKPSTAAAVKSSTTTASLSGGSAGTPSTTAAPTLAANVLKKVKAALKPLEGVEYPERDLFAAALTARLCDAFGKSNGESSLAQGKSTTVVLGLGCRTKDSKPAAECETATKGAQSPRKGAASSPLVALREWLVEQAGVTHRLTLKDHPLTLGPTLKLAPKWSGAGCGCVHPEAASWVPGEPGGTVMGFYPLWQAAGKLQKPDFNVFARISVFALSFDENGDLARPKWTDDDWDFVREAHRHHTQLDFTLYRDNWAFLKGLDSFERHRIADTVASQAVAFIDRPLRDPFSSAKAWLPGFAVTERVGDGLTVYLRPPASGRRLRRKFRRFAKDLIETLISSLQRANRQATLNVVMDDQALEAPDSVWPLGSLAQYIARASAGVGPDQVPTGTCYGPAAVKMCYLVLLSEPLAESGRQLRRYIENDRTISYQQRRFIRDSVIPVISTGSVTGDTLGNRFAQFADQFSGAGFWPVFDRGSALDEEVARELPKGFRYPGSGPSGGIEIWVCQYRWPLRTAFEGLLVLWLIGAVAYKTSCRVQKLGLPYLLGLLIGAVVLVLLGAVLLTWDPSLSELRKGNALLAALLIALIAMAGYQLVRAKTRVEKP